MALERLRGVRDDSGRRVMKTMSPPGSPCGLRSAVMTLLCLLSLLNNSSGLPVDPRNTGLQRRSVAEQQFMHDKGRVLQELGRRLWVQSVVGEVHTAMGRDANRVGPHSSRPLSAAASAPWAQGVGAAEVRAALVGAPPPIKNPASGKALAHRRTLYLQETDASGATWSSHQQKEAASKGAVRLHGGVHAPRDLAKAPRNARSVRAAGRGRR